MGAKNAEYRSEPVLLCAFSAPSASSAFQFLVSWPDRTLDSEELCSSWFSFLEQKARRVTSSSGSCPGVVAKRLGMLVLCQFKHRFLAGIEAFISGKVLNPNDLEATFL